MRLVSMAVRDELVVAIAERYGDSLREEKARILDEFVAVTGYHRKHAMRLLREGQRSSSLTRISILIIAADSRTIHSEYVGKTTGPEAMLAANRLVGHLGRGQKDQIN
jgi:hypothetical protein